MQILFIIGNGFDINLGMKTAYADFYNYYNNIETDNDLITKLKERIKKDYSSWADLELAFGNFTENISNTQDFDAVFDDLCQHLAEFLIKEEDNFDHSQIKKDLFFNYLLCPEKSLTPADLGDIITYKQNWNNHQHNFNIITLNYTRTIERIIDEPVKDLMIGSHNGMRSLLNGIYHIHGYTDDRMVLGVNDENQVLNKELLKNDDILDAIIKANSNKASKHNIDKSCAQLLNQANLICIFGSSIGDTDKIWWELVGDRLRHGARIIIFTKGEELNSRATYRIGRIERETKLRFLSKTNLTDIEKEKFKSNIYIGYNTDMFSIM